jgi:hypothetical protein
MVRLLHLFSGYRELRRAADENLRSLQAAERKLSELIAERDSWQKQALDWQQRFVEKDADLVNSLKRSTDALYIKATGMSMFGVVEPAPPQPVDLEKYYANQPRLPSEVRKERREAYAREAMKHLGLTGGAPTDASIGKTAEDLEKFFKAEQDNFAQPQ